MSRYLSTEEARNQSTYRADHATEPLGELAESSRQESSPNPSGFRLLRSGIPAEIFLFDRGTDRLVRPRRRAV